ncbi:mechanosensitive ion channel domain-containing protein [Pararhizobium haloflavum]|uniref:mechanosensitive ion channel domain-containing protein n=1 Tax=Pararhizobium haloflavum TaxID=2037914 RepID=UPI0018E452E0|nr:mechanosensitive ion channel domain-containing protein [Pararhizobium haloflavum]
MPIRILSQLFATFVLAAFLSFPVTAIAQDAASEPAEETATEAGAATPSELQLLIDALSNEESRNRLIDELQSAAEVAEPGPVETIDNALFGSDEVSLGRRIAETTRYFAEGVADSALGFWNRVAATPAMFSALDADQIGVLSGAFVDLLVVIIATYAIFLALRSLAKGVFRSMGQRAGNAGIVQKIVFIVASALVDALVVVIAWAAGYAISLFAFGDLGSMGLRQTLYLNAFMIVELMKVVLRIVLSPSTGDLRPVPIRDGAARSMNRGFTWIIGILGYGQLLVLPIVNQDISPAAGQAISALIALVALIIAVVMTVSSRKAVAQWLLERPEEELAAETSGDGVASPSPSLKAQRRNKQLRFLAHRWHWPVLLYLAFLFVIVLASPADVLLSVLGASGKILIAVVIGFAVAGWIARAIARGINLPDRVNQRLPLLERRLNAFVPKFLTVLRILIFIVVLLVVLDTLNFFDLRAWMQSQVGIRTTGALMSVFLILVIAFAMWLALNSWVDYRLNPDFGRPATSREQTLLSLLRNAATIAILVIALMFALSEIGINIAPLIASAGVLGLAIGFGAQKLVQDIITGVFIQLENAINVGDVITVGGMTGTVERLTIRSVSLRDVSGAYHIIPFSSVDMVTNFVRDFGYHVGDIGIGYRENVEDARAAIAEAFEALRKDPEMNTAIIGDMEWFGVQSLADSAVIVRVRIKTVPGKQWGVGRAFNAEVKRVFDERGIEIPFPHQTLYFGEDKRGRAPAAHILLEQKTTSADVEETPSEPKKRAARRKTSVRDNKDAIPHSDDDEDDAPDR